MVRNIVDLVYILTFAVLIALALGVVWALYAVGRLPGRIAKDRGHPHATAIGICGWLGLITLVLWPIAIASAYMTPTGYGHRRRSRRELYGPRPNEKEVGEEIDDLAEDLRVASQQIAAIKSRLAALPSLKRTA